MESAVGPGDAAAPAGTALSESLSESLEALEEAPRYFGRAEFEGATVTVGGAEYVIGGQAAYVADRRRAIRALEACPCAAAAREGVWYPGRTYVGAAEALRSVGGEAAAGDPLAAALGRLDAAGLEARARLGGALARGRACRLPALPPAFRDAGGVRGAKGGGESLEAKAALVGIGIFEPPESAEDEGAPPLCEVAAALGALAESLGSAHTSPAPPPPAPARPVAYARLDDPEAVSALEEAVAPEVDVILAFRARLADWALKLCDELSRAGEYEVKIGASRG